jgi:hypothetical protein
LLAESRDPAFCFLFIFRIGRSLQIAAQRRDDLVVMTLLEVNLRKN